jgi:pimeloyl-ACP methyl ester carboxylesterase
MDQPQVRYAVSPEGTDVAYATIGSGPPLVLADTFLFAGLDLRLRVEGTEAFYEALAAAHTVLLFDWRGVGLSGAASDFTLEGYVGDLEAVIDQAGYKRFDLVSMGSGCHVAIEYSSRHPESVRKLLMWRPGLKGLSARSAPRTSDVADLASSRWEAYTELIALRMFGWTESARLYCEQVRRHWTPQTFDACMTAIEQFDVSSRLPSINCEVLVLPNNDSPEMERAGRRMAAMLSRGRLGASVNVRRDAELGANFLTFFGEFETPTLETPVEAQPRALLFAQSSSPTSKPTLR